LASVIPTRFPATPYLTRTGLAPRVDVTRERLARGASVLRARGVHIPESDELTIAALEQLGVPAHAIVRLRRRARSTESEARTVARYACSHRLRSLAIVTSRPHSRRARLIYRRALAAAGGTPAYEARVDRGPGGAAAPPPPPDATIRPLRPPPG